MTKNLQNKNWVSENGLRPLMAVGSIVALRASPANRLASRFPRADL